MARNEEKQLARLNRFYLHKQKQEELIKRPPRPKLDTLTTPEELRKWLPSVKRDIEFYVKQMEVPCYRDKQIEEFNHRIQCLKGEYKAYLRKLHDLDPNNKVTPWTDRPYSNKRCKVASGNNNDSNEGDSCEQSSTGFVPLTTPVLHNDEQNQYYFGYEKPTLPHISDSTDNENMNQPLQFAPAKYPLEYRINDVENNTGRPTTKQLPNDSSAVSEHLSGSVLNLPYSDSSSDEET